MVSTISKSNQPNQSPELEITLEEFLQLPETKPASEYIEGKIHQKPMPNGTHSTLQTELVIAINQVARPQKIAYALTELRCTFEARAIVPDISIFVWERIPKNEDGSVANKVNISPDWIIEILSPEQSINKVMEKMIFAFENDTKLGWLIDPERKRVMVFQENQMPEIKSQDDQLPALEVMPDWQLSVADLFSWLYLH
ncbi:MAG: Uma2 family endonuclease [Coleofasciculaceae cyanobacterium SM2_1_6]|nr:Uma2 family endonuclease [Coleofasciculaceae cyanobacterium SM2_1_6]